jgi:hypothetical protein
MAGTVPRCAGSRRADRPTSGVDWDVTRLVVSLVSFALLVAAAAPAAAQPGATEPAPPPPAPPPPAAAQPELGPEREPPGTSSPSQADEEEPPDSGYVGLSGAMTGDVYFNGTLGVDGGARLPGVPLWARGRLEAGSVVDAYGGGTMFRSRVGVEARPCIMEGLCAILALEAGYQVQQWDPDPSNDEMRESELHHGVIFTGRTGLDLGGPVWRFRFELELSSYGDFSGDGTGWVTGGGLGLTILHRL